jgi:hypothetical protein
MMFSFNAFRFVLVLAAAYNAVPSAAEPTVELGFADQYVILAKAGISTVPQSVIDGDIAVSPIAATALTGFSLTADSTGPFRHLPRSLARPSRRAMAATLRCF